MTGFTAFSRACATACVLASVATAQRGAGRPAPSTDSTPARATAVPPAQWMPDRDYDQRHIKLTLRFDWVHEQAIGTAEITFVSLAKDLRSVEFNAANMTVSDVRLASSARLTYHAAADRLTVSLDRAYQPGEQLTVAIAYHTNGMSRETSVMGFFRRGLNFVHPAPSDPGRPRQIWSQGEPENNHFWFPSFDHPNDFVTSEVVATVDAPLQVISNGRLVERKRNADGSATFHWKIDQPHAVYLTSIVVGEFATVESQYDGIPVTSYVPPGEREEGRVTTARTADMVRFFSEETGLRYPYEKYAQTLARDFTGGVEFISATTMSDQTIHDARADRDQTADGIISHELAHQWFGDYVTCRSWSQLWLNEGFASYFQALWDEHRLGRDDFLYRDVKANQDQYYAAWNRGLRRPIVTANYANIDDLIDVYSYQRGAAVVHMLREWLGEDGWHRAISHYLHAYAHQPVSTEQLRIAVEEATGKPLDWFFDEWVYKMGHPVFRVAQEYDATAGTVTLTVKQEQKVDVDNPLPQAALFRTPLDVEIATTRGTRIERVMVEPVEEQAFTFPVDSKPVIVGFDHGGTVIKEVHFDKPIGDLVYQLGHDADLTGRLWALGELSRRSQDAATPDSDRERVVAAISSAASSDRFWGVRADAVRALGAGRGEAVQAALLAATEDSNSVVRSRAVAALG